MNTLEGSQVPKDEITAPQSAPGGTVTFLFTDIEGSTKLLEYLREQYAIVLADQRKILRDGFKRWNGFEIDTQGDSFFVAFTRAIDAVCCVVEAQKALMEHEWPQGADVRVRMGLHTGEPIIVRTGYVGMDIHRAARIAAAGHGGQVLVSQTTYDLIYQDLPKGISLRDLGSYKLKDIRYPQQIFQLDIDNLPSEFPALKTLSADEEPPTPGEPPYKGLMYFDEADAGWFFGRDLVIARLNEAIQSQRFLAVIGASGSGKSSVVRAGLVPALKHSAGQWQIHVLTPGAHPLESLAVELTRHSQSASATVNLMDDLRSDPRCLHIVVQKQVADAKLAPRLLLVVDQFEELFTLCRDADERQAFVDNLLYAVQCEGGAVSVLIALRADFYQHLAEYSGLRTLCAKQQEYIGAMSAEELRQAIEEPAKRGGWEFSPGLVDLILYDIGASEGHQPEPGALPLLSHALLETWKRRRGNLLSLRGYSEAGGVRGAIARTAENVYQRELTPGQQEIARNIFLRLTELGEGTQDTRRRVSILELIPPAPYGDPQQVEEVLVKLADARLITTSEGSAEVAHEALIREWSTLREWLSQDREGLRVHRHLTEATQEWELMEHDPGSLYRGARLAQALEWSENNPRQMNAQELTFLEASRQASERDMLEREAQRQRELEAAQKLAETQSTAARKLRRRAWLLSGAMALALLLATAAIFLGTQASQRANLATSRELANAATNNLGIDPERSILLAIEALKKADTLEARNALHQALPELHILRSLIAHDSPVTAVIHSPDGKLLASSSADRTTKIWDTRTGDLLQTIHFDKDTWDVAFSPDGKILVTAVYTQVIGSDPQTGVQLFALNGKAVGWEQGYNLGTCQVDFNPDGKLLVVANMDGQPVVWDLDTQRIVLRLDGHTDIVYGVDFSPDGKLIATASRDGTVRVWNAMTAQPIITLAQATSAWFDVQFSPDGSRLAAVNEGADLKIWEVDSWKELLSLARPETGGYQGMDWSPDGASLATASYDGVTRIWEAFTGQLLINLPGHASTVTDVDFSPDGKRLVSAGADRVIKTWDVGPGRELLTIRADSDNVRIAYSPDGSQLYTVGASGTPKIWDALSGQLLRTLPGMDPLRPLTSIALSPDGKVLAAGSGDGNVTVWNLENNQIARSWQAHANSIIGISFSPDGEHLVTSSLDGMGAVWEIATGQAISKFDGHAQHAGSAQMQMVFGAAFSPDSLHVATAGYDGAVRVWDSTTGQEIYNVTDGKALFSAVAFSPDGKLLAAGEFDSPLLIVDAASGAILHKSTGHSAGILDVRFSADSKYIATASFDRLAKLWDAASGQELASFYGNAKNAWSVSLTPDGKHLAAGGWDGTARTYIINLDELINLAKTRVTRPLTTEECQKYLHVEQCPVEGH